MTGPLIRPLDPADLPGLRALIDATGLFPSDLLDGMVAEGDLWLAAEAGGAVAGVLFAAPERMTDGTWNALLLAVHPDHHRRGLGRALMEEGERRLLARGARLLLVETSALDAFAGPRRFYRALGYAEEGRIREFYAPGEDKVIFRKAL